MFKRIYKELKHHIPFTAFGAITGIIFMVFLRNLPAKASYNIFYIFHPAHVLLSALATASMYEAYRRRANRKKCNIFMLLFIGYVGSVGIATLSDSVIPYVGETLLNMPHKEAHIGFIEKWWLVNPLAILGVAIAYFRPSTKFSHYGHVLVSTWASLFHILMAAGGNFNLSHYSGIFLFLFLAVWVPCCVSDIIFPLLFVRSNKNM
ncbi:MAG: hypothetical protein ABIH08_01510 [Candidatus Omnitrophota bacterium]